MGDHIFNRVLNRLGIYSLADDKDSDLRFNAVMAKLGCSRKMASLDLSSGFGL